MEPVKSTVDARAQVKQSGTIDCIKEFLDSPQLTIVFS